MKKLIGILVLLSSFFATAQVELAVQKGHSDIIELLEFSQSGKYLASKAVNNEVIIWDVILGKTLGSFSVNEKEEVIGMKFTPDEAELKLKTKYTTIFYNIQGEGVIRKHDADTSYRDKEYFLDEAANFETFLIDGAIKKKRRDKRFKKYKLAVTYLNAPFKSFDVHRGLNLIIGVAADEKIYVYNYKNGMRQKVLGGHNSEIRDVRFTKDGKYFATAGKDRSIILWRTRDFRIEKRLSSDVYKKKTATFSQDGLRIYVGDELGYIYSIDLSTVFPKIEVTQPNFHSVNRIVRSPRGFGYFVASSNNNVYYKEDPLDADPIRKFQFRDRAITKTRRLLLQSGFNTYQEPFGEVTSCEVSPSGTKILYTGNCDIPNISYAHVEKRKVKHLYNSDSDSLWSQWSDVAWLSDSTFVTILESSNMIYTWDISHKRRVLVKTDVFPFEIENVLSLGNNHLWISSKDQGQYLFNTANRKLEKKIDRQVKNLFKHENYVILATAEHDIVFWDRETEKIYHTFRGHSEQINDLNFHPSKNLFISSSDDGTVKLWNMDEKKLIVSIIPFRTEEFVFITDENYYLITKGAMGEIGFKEGRQFFFPEQFDLKYNRPDIVLKEMGFSNQELIAAYNKAYQKRLKKLNFTQDQITADFHLPETEILNLNSLPTKTDQSTLNLQLKFSDQLYTLDRINLYVNDVAVKGKDGIDLRKDNVKEFEGRFAIDLAHGENKIEVSVLNQAGAESYKQTVLIESTAGKKKPDLYLVTLGVSKYKDKEFNLEYAAKDAKDMAKLFATNSYFNEVKTKSLVDENVKLERLKELKAFIDLADINDIVVVFVAGHGVLDNNFDYFFASHDMDFNNPALRGIPYEEVEGLLDGIRALKKLLFLDTCHSGEVDKDDLEEDLMPASEQGDLIFRSAGVNVKLKGEALLDSEGDGAFGLQSINELMRTVFSDLRKGTGATVISSSGGEELSIESEIYKNGLFTYCLLNGLENKQADLNRDNQIDVSELQLYVRDEVTRLSQGKQTPTSRITNDELDYRLW